jgi:hypothetical protein
VLTAIMSATFWLVPAVLVGLAIAAGAMVALRRQRNCPSCRTDMRTLARPGQEGGMPSYEVLVCDSCTNVATLVHGHQARFAYCPSCLNRSLRTPCIRQPDSSVKVEERCELCGFGAERVFFQIVPDPEPTPMGQVIPFPTRPRRRESGKVDEA